VSLADHACRLNVPVFPCDARKRPIVAGGFKAASVDPSVIRELFAGDSAVMIGMPTGPASGMFVVDVDVKGAARGMEWLAENQDALPPTLTHRTGSGGRHVFLRYPTEGAIRNSASKIAPGVDVRGDGGYVIVPPSPGYTVICGGPVATAPAWLLSVIRQSRALPPVEQIVRGTGRLADRVMGRVVRSLDRVARAGEGQRNDTLNREAFILALLVREGLAGREDMRGELWNAARQAGLADPEIKATIGSAFAAALS
jgi:Bifunctional DNA primase/polymerase, N-terminal